MAKERTKEQQRRHEAYLKWKEDYPEKYEASKKKAAKWSKENPEKHKKNTLKYKNSDKGKARRSEQVKKYLRNPEKREAYNERARKWRAKNSEKSSALSMKYAAKIRQDINDTYVYHRMFDMFSQSADLKKFIDRESIDFKYLMETKRLMLIIQRRYIKKFMDLDKTKLKETMKATIIKQKELSTQSKISSNNTQEIIELLLKAVNKYDTGKITKAQLMPYVHVGNTVTKAIFGKYTIDQALLSNSLDE